MRTSAPGSARTRRLASLLGGTALVSVAALSMAVTDASAACTVTPAGTVNCLASTTTTNTTNTNGATNPSSDRAQEFNNGANITGVMTATVDGYGLQLSLINAGPNTIDVINSGTVTTSQDPVNALELNGNGGSVTYTGTGTVSTTGGNGHALAITNSGAGGVTVTNDGILNSAAVQGLFIVTQGTGTITANGSGAVSGGFGGIFATANDAADINITSAGAISGHLGPSGGTGISVQSGGGNVLIATGSTVSGYDAILASTVGNGTITVVTGGVVTGPEVGISTSAINGATTINAGHDVTAGQAIGALGQGSGLLDINHTLGTITAVEGVVAQQTGSGAIDISQTGGALNATTRAVVALMTGSGNVAVSLTAGTVGTTSGNVIETSATTGTTTITADVNLTSTGGNGIQATSTTGTVNVNGSGAISGNGGINVSATDAANINVTSSGSISGSLLSGIYAETLGGNVVIATTSTVAGGNHGIDVRTSANGTVTVDTVAAVSGSSGHGIRTTAVNGGTTVNAGQNVTGSAEGIRSLGNGSGVVDINHSAGIIAAGTVGISASQSGSGNIDISQSGGALNGTTQAVNASMTGSGNVIVSLTGGTVGNVSGNAVETSATTGTTTITADVNLTSTVGNGIRATSTTGTINLNGSGAISSLGGVYVAASGAANINVTSGGSITGVSNGIYTETLGGNVVIATTSTVVAVNHGIDVRTSFNGTVTIDTVAAVTSSSGSGIRTTARDGNTTVNAGQNVTGAIEGIWSRGNGSGVVDINHTAGTISGAIGISATHSGSGSIDISQTGGALNGVATAVLAQTTGAGNLIVSLTGGTVGNVSGNAVETSATTATTMITSSVGITSTAANAINATATSGNIAFINSSVVTGATNAVFGSTSGAFDITNSGTLNGNVNVTGSSAASTFANSGGWNAGTAGSTFSGNLNNTGTVNVQNGAAGQVVTFAGNYSGNGAYRVDVDAAGNADRMNVGGTANLTGGSVNALFLPGAYVNRNYTILSATGGLGGTTFSGGLTTTALPAGFTAELSYTSTDVLLDLAAILAIGGNFNQNQQNVAGTINNFFNNGGALPPGFVTVFGLTGSSLGNALTQFSGEHVTGLQPAANLSTGMFLNAMLDPFVIGRSGGFGAATGYAAEEPSRGAATARDAFAAYTKAPVAVPFVEPRWSVWGSAYGGRNRTDGDAVVGSNDLRASAAGFAVGADYRVLPGTVIGAAVAVGENNWNVSDFGKGKAELAQFGGYFSSRWNSLYISGAAAVATHRASTERTLTVAGIDRLTAGFHATSFGGRLESGYRVGNTAFGVTPYAAVQVTGIHTPSYSEAAAVGLNQFALSYQAQSTTDARTELGTWADTRHQFGNGALLTLRGRAAWVHDYNPGSRINAAFQTLPGTSFVVDGAAAPRNAALTSVVAELRMTTGWTLIGKFDGEFSDRSHTLAGTGTLKYAW
jgi:hypothetical protein